MGGWSSPKVMMDVHAKAEGLDEIVEDVFDRRGKLKVEIIDLDRIPLNKGEDHFTIDEIYVDKADDYFSRVPLAFQAKSHDDVALFYKMAVEAGGKPNGRPGYRSYYDQHYAAFVLDPDGNNIDAVCDQPSSRSVEAVVVKRK